MIQVYADTSVFGGCFDDEFEEWSNKLMGEFNLGLKAVVISDLTLKELEGAPPYVRNLVGEILFLHRLCVLFWQPVATDRLIAHPSDFSPAPPRNLTGAVL